MKIRILYTFLTIWAFTFSFGQDTLHIDTYGSGSNEEFRDIKFFQNRYYVVGSNNGCESRNILVYVFDENLSPLHQISYGSENYIEVAEAIAIANNRIYICGFTNETPSGTYNPMFLEIDFDGQVLNKKVIQYDVWTTCNDLIATPSGNLIGVGKRFSSHERWEAYYFSVDSDLNLLWERIVLGDSDEELLGVCKLNNKYVGCGYTESFGAGGKDLYLIAFDENGNGLWNSTIGGAEDDFGNRIISTLDGGLAIFGTTSSYNSVSEDTYLVKTNSRGELIWTNLHQVQDSSNIFSDRGIDLIQKSDSSYMLFSYLESYGIPGAKDVSIMHADKNGNWIKGLIYLGSEEDQPYAGLYLNDSSFVIVGSTSSSGQGASDAFIGRFTSAADTNILITENLSSLNCVTLSIEENDIMSSIYPNPFTNQITINNLAKGLQSISLFDVSGKLIWSGSFTSGDSFTMPRHIEKGIYCLRINNELGSTSQLIMRAE